MVGRATRPARNWGISGRASRATPAQNRRTCRSTNRKVRPRLGRPAPTTRTRQTRRGQGPSPPIDPHQGLSPPRATGVAAPGQAVGHGRNAGRWRCWGWRCRLWRDRAPERQRSYRDATYRAPRMRSEQPGSEGGHADRGPSPRGGRHARLRTVGPGTASRRQHSGNYVRRHGVYHQTKFTPT